MINLAFVDVESRKVSADFPDGWGPAVHRPGHPDVKESWTSSNVPFMELGMACVYDNTGIRFYHDPLECVQALLNPGVDGIVTFNGEGFDFHLLLGCIAPPEKTANGLVFGEDYLEAFSSLEAKSIDVLRIITNAVGHRIKLDQLTSVMFDHKKDVDPVNWWPLYNGTFEERVQAINYLLADVIQLRKVWAVGQELGELAFRDNLGTTRKFPVKMPVMPLGK